jgi:hypothetical protein
MKVQSPMMETVSGKQWAVSRDSHKDDRSHLSDVSGKYSQRQSAEGRASDAESLALLTAHCSLLTTKLCPICSRHLPLAEFGVCRARKDGRNLYCKGCIRDKVYEGRRRLRERHEATQAMLAAQQGQLPLIAEARPQYANGVLLESHIRRESMPHDERVFAAIVYGARTQAEILRAIRPAHQVYGGNLIFWDAQLDRIGESLAQLILGEPKRVSTKFVGGVRHYFAVAQVRTPKAAVRDTEERAA